MLFLSNLYIIHKPFKFNTKTVLIDSLNSFLLSIIENKNFYNLTIVLIALRLQVLSEMKLNSRQSIFKIG